MSKPVEIILVLQPRAYVGCVVNMSKLEFLAGAALQTVLSSWRVTEAALSSLVRQTSWQARYLRRRSILEGRVQISCSASCCSARILQRDSRCPHVLGRPTPGNKLQLSFLVVHPASKARIQDLQRCQLGSKQRTAPLGLVRGPSSVAFSGSLEELSTAGLILIRPSGIGGARLSMQVRSLSYTSVHLV